MDLPTQLAEAVRGLPYLLLIPFVVGIAGAIIAGLNHLLRPTSARPFIRPAPRNSVPVRKPPLGADLRSRLNAQAQSRS